MQTESMALKAAAQQVPAKRGLFITLEGTEGAGKSSLILSLSTFLQQKGFTVLSLREPGGTEIGEEIRAMLKSPERREQISPLTELLLMYASRVQLVESRIKPALKRGIMVLCDRHDLSSYAYQGGGRGIPFETIRAVRTAALGDFHPDLTLLLDLPVEQGMQRVRARGERDRFEQERLDFFERVQRAYLQAAAQLDYVKVIDSSRSFEEVAQDAVRLTDSALCQAGLC